MLTILLWSKSLRKMKEQQKVIMKVHPEALKVLVDQSLEFIEKMYWPKQHVLRNDEGEFIKSCISEYYHSIPAEDFTEKSKVYQRHLYWQVFRMKVNAGANYNLKMFVPFAYAVWKQSISKQASFQNA